MTPISLRTVAVSVAASVLCATASPARAQDTTHSLRAEIGREAARLAESSARRATWDTHVRYERGWVDRRAAAGTASQPQAVLQEPRWVGRHPALTGALIGAAVGATYAYVMCRGACEGQPELYMALLGGAGAGIGAGAGAIVGVLR